MPSEQHQSVVRKLSELGASTHDFKQAVLKAIRRDCDQETADGLKTDLEPSKITPDAYRIDHEHRTVVVFEVEKFSALDEVKMSHYIHWWWMLDDLLWDLRLIIVRCFANTGVCFEIDLRDVVYAEFSKDPAAVLSISRVNCTATIFNQRSKEDVAV